MFDAAQAVDSASSGPARPDFDRDPAGGKIRERLHDRERTDPVGPVRGQLENAILERSDTAERTRDGHTDAFGVLGHVQARIALGLPRGGNDEVVTPIHPAGGLAVDVVADLETL